MRVRHTTRALLLNPQRQILLVRMQPQEGPSIWVTPGGGVEVDEDLRAALLRELLEETGFTQVTIEGEAFYLEHPVEIHSEIQTFRERFFLAHTPQTEICIDGHTEDERIFLKEIAWFDLQQLQTIREAIRPRQIVPVILNLLRAPSLNGKSLVQHV